MVLVFRHVADWTQQISGAILEQDPMEVDIGLCECIGNIYIVGLVVFSDYDRREPHRSEILCSCFVLFY